MKTILYATDYSKQSITALQFAHDWSKKMKAELIVLHVFDIPISLASPVTITYARKEQKRYKEHRAKLKSFCDAHLEHPTKGKKIRIEVGESVSPADGIIEKAVELKADLIVVGAKGASKLKELILGSTSKVLIRKAPCAVLTVPENAEMGNIKAIVYATDFEEADIFALRKLTKLAISFNATIKVIHISTKKDYEGAQQMQWFKEMLQERVVYDKLEFNLIYSESIYEELNGFLEGSRADILAMLEREKGMFQKLFNGDLVTKMESDISIPLLRYSVAGL